MPSKSKAQQKADKKIADANEKVMKADPEDKAKASAKAEKKIAEAHADAAIDKLGVARGEVFVTTKIWTEHLAADALIPSLEESLRKLRMDTVDLTLIHWPSPGAAVPVAESMREVASSSSRMRGSPASARAIAISCFWPEDRREPPSPSEVS